MTCGEIIAQIEKDYPTSCALEWDNVGLLAGRMDKEVKRVYIGLDATDPVIREAADKGADLLLTHHPLLFHGINRVTDQDFLGNRVLNLIRSDISYYAMHTNYDVVRMAQLAAARLGWKGARPLEPAVHEGQHNIVGIVFLKIPGDHLIGSSFLIASLLLPHGDAVGVLLHSPSPFFRPSQKDDGPVPSPPSVPENALPDNFSYLPRRYARSRNVLRRSPQAPGPRRQCLRGAPYLR